LRSIVLSVLALAALSGAALAQAKPPVAAPPPLPLSTSLLEIDGKTPVPDLSTRPADDTEKADPSCKKCQLLTLRDVLERALTAVLPGDTPAVDTRTGRAPEPTPEQLSGGVQRMALAVKIASEPTLTLDSKDTAMLVNRVKMAYYGTIMALRAVQLIDPNNPDVRAP
jgi:hypothetical protein